MFFANPPVDESIVPILSTSISFKLLTSIPTFSRRLIFFFADGWSCKLFSGVIFFLLGRVLFLKVYVAYLGAMMLGYLLVVAG